LCGVLTIWKSKVQNAVSLGALLEVEHRKSVKMPRVSTIWKSKVLKTGMFEALLEVEFR
jgi:hypothetical protein